MVVDEWLDFNGCTLAEDNKKEFYTLLVEKLIDNSFDNPNMALQSWRNRGDRNVSASPTLAADTGAPQGGVAAHITQTKQRRIRKDGTITKFLMQGRCMECKKKIPYFCSQFVDNKAACLTNSTHSDPWICATKNGKLCYANHTNGKHLLELLRNLIIFYILFILVINI